MGSLRLIDNAAIWTAGIPNGWQLVQLKHVVTKLNRVPNEDDPVLICTNKGTVIPRDEGNPGLISLTNAGYQGVEPGDLLIHGMDTWHGAIAVSSIMGQCTSVVHVCDSSQDKRFIAYYLRALAFRGVYKAFSNGVRQNTSDFRSWVKAGEIPLILPTIKEQRHIADCLDAKCADIDEAIQSAENSISDYRSYLQARLYQMVTKGLDPAVASEKTSLEWIESAPTHWEIAPHKRMMRKIKRLCDHWADEPVLSLTTNGVIVRDIASGKGKFPATFDGYQYISAGNLVLCLFDVDVTPRCVGLAKQGGVISPAYSQFEMLDGAYAPYYDYYLRAMDDRKLYVHLTSTLRHSFTEDTFGMIPALRPPFEEQVRIAAYLDDFCSNVDRLINAKQSIIDDLKAYKQSLIYETVTGKKEV